MTYDFKEDSDFMATLSDLLNIVADENYEGWDNYWNEHHWMVDELVEVLERWRVQVAAETKW